MGALATGLSSPLNKILLAAAGGAMIMAAGNVINDYFDIEIDRINKPGRPLAAGLVTPVAARRAAFLLFGLGIVLSAFINPPAVVIAVSASLLLYFYSARLKRMVLWGNLAVSLATALAFIYGGTAVGRPALALIPAGFAFLFHLGREVLKDMEDVPGDARDGIMTLPIRHGPSIAIRIITITFVLLILFTLLPYVFKVYGLVYLLLVVPGVDAYLVYVLVSLRRNPTQSNYRRLSRGLKLNMLMGLLAILAGVKL